MVNVFSDFHHGALYFSLHLLFEKRLGWNLYRPTGYEWYKRGFWRYSSDPRVIKQYLEEASEELLKHGVYRVPSQEGSVTYFQNAITFTQFLEMDFDFIIASVYQHEGPFFKLITEYKPDAALIRQMGNPNEVCDFSVCRNVLNSTMNPVPQNVNTVRYHPEFSLEDFRYTKPETHNVVKSFLNCLPMSVDAPLWDEYSEAMPDFVWKMHGILGKDELLPEGEKAKAMRMASFIWHLKFQGDGYGFVIHNAYACGRPCIVKGSYYREQLAEALLEDSVTCIDLELGSKDENVKKIRWLSKPENHVEICENAYKHFKKHVDFDREFVQVKKFLERT